MNPPTIIATILVFALIGAVAYKIMRDKHNHKSSCGGGCAGCPCSGQCHGAAAVEKDKSN